MLKGTPTTSQWSTIPLPAKVWVILEVWWQGKRELAFSRKICGIIKKPTFPSLISFLHLGTYAYPGGYNPAGNFIRCMCMYYISTDWCAFIPFPQHHSPDVDLCGIISFSVMLGACSVLPQSWAIPLRCQRFSENGQWGPNLVWDALYVCKQLTNFHFLNRCHFIINGEGNEIMNKILTISLSVIGSAQQIFGQIYWGGIQLILSKWKLNRVVVCCLCHAWLLP